MREAIQMKDGKAVAPDRPVILYIEGDGIGPDIRRAAMPVFEVAVEKAYGGVRKVEWKEILAGEKAHRETGEWLPEQTIDAIREYKIAIKGPLTTPVGGGIRSLNVTLRQRLDLFVCLRPVTYIAGTPAPTLRPELMDVVIFRENTEDVYAGIEWRKGESETEKIISFLNREMGRNIRADSGIGIKPVSEFASKRLVRAAIRYAVERGRESVTLVHKGNIMKFTEGAFRDWGYEVARDEFGGSTVTEAEIEEKFGGKAPAGKVIIKDRIADAMFQQLLLRPDEYDVIATTNLNGDYLSDACAAQVGGLGMAPGANVGDSEAVFEATHGTAPRHAGLDRVNPSSLILSGALMYDFIGWGEAAALIREALAAAIRDKTVTYDLHRQMEGATLLKCSEFGDAVAEKIK